MAASSSPSSSSSSSLSTFLPKLPSSTTNYPNSSNPNNNPSKFNPQITNTDFNSDPPLPSSPSLKLKPSVQLNRWSRTRALRSNRRFKNPDQPTTVTTAGMNSPIDQKMDHNNKSNLDNSEDERERKTEEEKSIYMVSDGTGWTAEHYVGAALGQFEHCLRDRGCSLNTHIFSGIGDTERLLEIIKQAAKEGAMLVYTLADPTMADSAKQACEMWGVPSTDILSPITEAISAHLGVSPSGIPRGAPGRHVTLSEDYFRRIEAIEFTIKQDDGALPQNLHKADIILAGVSRTGKTPLSIYLSQKGYKVANVPIVMGVELPKTLFEVDVRKIFGLTINPIVLQAIRTTRAKTLGLGDGMKTNYFEMDYVRSELDHARRIFAENPSWPVIDMTGKAIEETAAVLLRLFHEQKQNCSVPRISKRY